MIWDTSVYINISINTPTTQSEDVQWGEGCKFIGCGTKRLNTNTSYKRNGKNK